jgi:tetratricopeptide (TPR) repeat protein
MMRPAKLGKEHAMEDEQYKVWQKNLEELMGKMQTMKDEIREKGSVGDAVGVTEDEKQDAYALGYRFFQQKKYDKAMTIFDALFILDPIHKDFSKAVAATLQMSGNLPDAAIQYLISYFFNQDDLSLILYAGRCMMELGQVLPAYYIMRSVVEAKKYSQTSENIKVRDTIQALLKILKKQVDSLIAAGKQGEAAKSAPPAEAAKMAESETPTI